MDDSSFITAESTIIRSYLDSEDLLVSDTDSVLTVVPPSPAPAFQIINDLFIHYSGVDPVEQSWQNLLAIQRVITWLTH